MRVGLFIQKLPVGGAEHTLVRMAKEFLLRGYEVDVYLYRKQGALLEKLPKAAQVFDLDEHGKFAIAARYWKMGSLFKLRKPDAVIAFMNGPSILLGGLAARGRYAGVSVGFLHINTAMEMEHGPRYKKLLPWFFHRYLPGLDAVVHVESDSARNLEALAGLTSHSVRTIFPLIVEADVDERAALPPEHPWLIEKNDPVIVAAGRLAEQKNHGMLIDAMVKVRATVPNARLIIFGEGELRSALQARIEKLQLADAISLPGVSSNVLKEIAKADVVALPSNHEALPGVLCEALALGRPCVATDCKTGPRTVLEDGTYGILVPVGDTDAFAEALIQQLMHPLFPNPATADRFRVDAVMNQWCRLLDDLKNSRGEHG